MKKPEHKRFVAYAEIYCKEVEENTPDPAELMPDEGINGNAARANKTIASRKAKYGPNTISKEGMKAITPKK